MFRLLLAPFGRSASLQEKLSAKQTDEGIIFMLSLLRHSFGCATFRTIPLISNEIDPLQ